MWIAAVHAARRRAAGCRRQRATVRCDVRGKAGVHYRGHDATTRRTRVWVWSGAVTATSPPGGRKREGPSPAWAETAPAGSGRRSRLGPGTHRDAPSPGSDIDGMASPMSGIRDGASDRQPAFRHHSTAWRRKLCPNNFDPRSADNRRRRWTQFPCGCEKAGDMSQPRRWQSPGKRHQVTAGPPGETRRGVSANSVTTASRSIVFSVRTTRGASVLERGACERRPVTSRQRRTVRLNGRARMAR